MQETPIVDLTELRPRGWTVRRPAGAWILALALGACAKAGDAPAALPGARLTPEALAAATYRLPDGTAATLLHGKRRVPAAPVGATVTMDLALRADLTAFGDLDGDGVDDAAVILIDAPGGSGVFVYLAAVLNAAGTPVNRSTVALGDRTRIESLTIGDSRIVVDVVTHGERDPMCCPTERRVWTYRLRRGRLERAGDPSTARIPAASAANADAQGTTAATVLTQNMWQWQATLMNDGTSRNPADPAAYTIRFEAKGTVSVKADCNAASGTFRAEGKAIEIIIGPMTLAACPPGSLSLEFVRDLGVAALWMVRNQQLLLDLKLDSGTMRFVGAPYER